MVNQMLSEVSINKLIRFVHNDLTESDMDKVELFLQENDVYANIVDGLIELVKDKQLSVSETKQFLSTPIELSKKQAIRELIFELLNEKYNDLKLDMPAFKTKVKAWFAPLPPNEFGVSLMSDSIEFTQPVEDGNFTNIIKFVLTKPVPENDIYMLSIFESNNKLPIFEKKINEAKQELSISIEKQALHPGIYYWRMQSLEKGTKSEGRFYVNQQLYPFE